MSTEDESFQFRLTGSEQSFATRSQDIFGGLDTLEQRHKAVEQTWHKRDQKRGRDDDDDAVKSMKRDPKADKTDPDVSKFRRPVAPSRYRHQHRRYGRVPEHKKNPGKWTKYDLSDVPTDQLSNASNTAAAFEFLRDRHKQKEKGTDNEDELMDSVEHEEDETEGRNVGAHSTHRYSHKSSHSFSNKNKDKSSEKPTEFIQGKVRMPEYVVGVSSKAKKQPRSNQTPSTSASTVQISYLTEGETAEGDQETKDQKESEEIVNAEHVSTESTVDKLDKMETVETVEKVQFKRKKDRKRRPIRQRTGSDEED